MKLVHHKAESKREAQILMLKWQNVDLPGDEIRLTCKIGCQHIEQSQTEASEELIQWTRDFARSCWTDAEDARTIKRAITFSACLRSAAPNCCGLEV